MTFTAGDHITVRGERWVVHETTAFTDSTLLHLETTDEQGPLRRCRLLTPFDRPIPIRRTLGTRATTPRRWMHHLHALHAERRVFGELQAPLRAGIELLPFQLEPALAVARGAASRFLLADEVGLGKTIQAGLMLAELRQRGWCEHALIVTPPGLRPQWTEELWRRFEIRAAVMDSASLAAQADALPFDVNPWTVEPVVMTSIDYLKQPEVIRALSTHVWDLLIVDEAHQATTASMRYAAIDALAVRARHVVLLTATPHAGDDHAYRALCAIGQLENTPMVLFRRTREQAGLPRSRRAHLLPVKMTLEAVEMHRLLADYLAQLWTRARTSHARELQLVAMVLGKRGFSSARSLAASLERRLAGIADRHAGEVEGAAQTTLPFGFDEDPSDEATMPVAPAFERPDEERSVLQRLLDATRSAQRTDPKMCVLRRIVRRVREPLIIFTEYRDTLDAIRNEIGGLRRVTALHGGQTSHERKESVRAFTEGTADVLIATDAGSEGLNLHETCRLVLNLELPWNPIRLEQRVGRVDRIGQTRTVHAINLIADGTMERTVLASLLRRIDRIRMSEIDIAACVIDHAHPPQRSVPAETCTQTIDLGAAARAEARRLWEARRIRNVQSHLPDGAVPVTVVRAAEAALIAFFRIRLVTRAGRLLENDLVPIRLPINPPRRRLNREEARSLAESLMRNFGSQLLGHACAHGHDRARTLAAEAALTVATAALREQEIARSAAARGLHFVQAGLFDTRALKQKWTRDERRNAILHQSADRATLLEADSNIRLANDPELVMLLIQCSQA
jgi:superfamily II DNA or RNA helicase